MRNFVRLLAMTLAASALSSPALAHHSTAAYDYTKSATLTGTVTKFAWTNPHMFIHIRAPGPDGKVAEWQIECGTPNINIRHGWKPSDFKAGDKVTLQIRPLRDGSPGGTLFNAKLADGRQLWGPAHDVIVR